MEELICYDSDMDGIGAAFIYIKKKGIHKYNLFSKRKASPLLLEDIFKSGIRINLFDQSVKRNKLGILRELEKGNTIFSVDHHDFSEISHPNFKYVTSLGNYHCTSSLMDMITGEKYPLVALAGALSDNVGVSNEIKRNLTLEPLDLKKLLETSKLITFNSINLFVQPELILESLIKLDGDLFKLKQLRWYNQLEEIFYESMNWVSNNPPEIKSYQSDTGVLKFHLLGNSPHAKNIFATYATETQIREPDNVHIIFAPNGNRYSISIRAPNFSSKIAKNLFNGGGRKTAAGGNIALDRFLINDDLASKIIQILKESENEE